jgi:hypothetical protein
MEYPTSLATDLHELYYHSGKMTLMKGKAGDGIPSTET